jgi:hypothetical protein
MYVLERISTVLFETGLAVRVIDQQTSSMYLALDASYENEHRHAHHPTTSPR